MTKQVSNAADGDPPNKFRLTLRDAISAANEAALDLTAAIEAKSLARDRYSDAQKRCDGLTGPGDDADETSAAFIDSVRNHEPCDMAVLGAPAKQRADALAAAKHEAAVWQKTIAACEAAIPEREKSVDRARRSVERAAADVVRHCGVASTLLDGLEELEAEVFARRLTLYFLARNDLIPEADKGRAKAALRETQLPGWADAVFFQQWLSQPPWTGWESALAALQSNADAPLPSHEGRRC